jgi:hypothetical protein
MKRDVDALMETARASYAPDPRLLERAWSRLEARRPKPRILVVAVALAAGLLVLARSWPLPEAPRPTAEAPNPVVSIPADASPPPIVRAKGRAVSVAVLPDPAPAPVPPVIRADPPVIVRAEPAAKKRPYQPRAIIEFQQVDWPELEAHDELPAYVRAIIDRRDPRALLAALDAIDVEGEIRIVRGELRAGAARCTDAVTDFGAILDDAAARDLHGRAELGLRRCR